MNRRRGVFSMPEEFQTNERLFTKKELATRNTAPTCPGVPIKFSKMVMRKRMLYSEPKAVFFNRQVKLSDMYNDKKNVTYMNQCFLKMQIIGEGSFGVVYKVRCRETNEFYAVKRAKPHINVQDCLAEIENNEKVGHHPNIVKYYMAWQEWSQFHLQLEYCEMSLAMYAKKDSDMSEEMCWNILYDICQALAFLHDKDLLHLDVKPGNILLKQGHFKLADFGLLVDLKKIPEPFRNNAKLTGEAKKEVRNCLSTLSDGDSKYLAAEVLDTVYTTGCDIFGLGITILECSADLDLPEHGPLWHQIRHGILPKEFHKRASLGLQVLIEKMLYFNCTMRPAAQKILSYQYMRELAKRDKKHGRTDFARPFINDNEVHNFIDYYDECFLDNNNTKSVQPHSVLGKKSLQFLNDD
ncbi:unnamed protein product [Brassicogethes aeneus]|uniref:non-specific serine/threonine protein kinase n=1 Tax=Brassicogethes aeneus TaxID=1431903 RepID=A0A9P0FMR6_BRAAE|nr:unnamed protein product [Brassicogethes aeneus]